MEATPGSVVSLKPLVVRCGTGLLELVDVQMEGRKRIADGSGTSVQEVN